MLLTKIIICYFLKFQAEPDSLSHLVTHHTHFMEGWLPVEDDEISVANVALHFVAALQVEVRRLGVEPEVDPLARVADDVLGARVLGVAPPDQVLHLVDVERGHDLGEGQVLRDGAGHADLGEKLGYFCVK